jgi:hypothetical protein
LAFDLNFLEIFCPASATASITVRKIQGRFTGLSVFLVGGCNKGVALGFDCGFTPVFSLRRAGLTLLRPGSSVFDGIMLYHK